MMKPEWYFVKDRRHSECPEVLPRGIVSSIERLPGCDCVLYRAHFGRFGPGPVGPTHSFSVGE